MASPSSGTGSADGYDVYISYPRAEAAWAQLLYRDLSERGLECFFDQNLAAGEPWEEASQQALDRSGALVVLWTTEARESKQIRTELARFRARTGETREPRPIVPLILGGADLGTAPQELSSRQAVIVGHDTYEAGPETDSKEWRDAVLEIAQWLEPYVRLGQFRRKVRRSRSSGVEAEVPGEAPAGDALEAQAEAPLPSFSRAALRALSYTAEMAGTNTDPARLRTAALLGALRASAVSGMGPSTGDVVRLVLDRQTGRDAVQTLAAAAAAAGLEPIEDPEPEAAAVERLLGSNVSQLVEDAIAIHRRVGADGVHLHHVLATGVDRVVSADALAELRITLSELREHWLASIRSRWPDESSAAWDAILAEPPAEFDLAGGVSRDAVDPTRGIPLTEDHLGVRTYVAMLATVIADSRTPEPLSIGLFGEWGSGKSYFMGLLREQVKQLSRHGDPYCRGIRQIAFNAWHYSDTNIWASLGDEIFEQLAQVAEPVEELRRQLREQHAESLQRRKELETATERARRKTARLRRELNEAREARSISTRAVVQALAESEDVQRDVAAAFHRLGITTRPSRRGCSRRRPAGRRTPTSCASPSRGGADARCSPSFCSSSSPWRRSRRPPRPSGSGSPAAAQRRSSRSCPRSRGCSRVSAPHSGSCALRTRRRFGTRSRSRSTGSRAPRSGNTSSRRAATTPPAASRSSAASWPR